MVIAFHLWIEKTNSRPFLFRCFFFIFYLTQRAKYIISYARIVIKSTHFLLTMEKKTTRSFALYGQRPTLNNTKFPLQAFFFIVKDMILWTRLSYRFRCEWSLLLLCVCDLWNDGLWRLWMMNRISFVLIQYTHQISEPIYMESH